MEQVYVDIQWDKKKGKKVCNFTDSKGGKWGSLPKNKANATAVKTGKGTVVVDIDTKDLNSLDPKLRKMLGEPTIETKRGYHYYFKTEDSKEFTTGTDLFKHVDIRSEGGLVFNDYWGDNKNIAYEKVGEPEKMPKKLGKYLLKTYHEKSGGDSSKKNKAKVNYNNTPKKKMKEILKHIDCYDDYTDWFKVGMALKDWDEVEGLQLWDKWSKQSDAYDKNACADKWGTFANDGEMALGSLYHLAEENGYVIEKAPDHTKKKGSGKVALGKRDLKEVLKKPKKKKGKTSGKSGSAFERMSEFALDDSKLKERADQKILFQSVVIERMHTFVYGKSGSNKTTIFGWMAIDILKNHPNKKVQFWSFDAHNDHERSIYNYMQDNGVGTDRMQILSDNTSEDYYSYYQEILDNDEDLSEFVILIDTFKFVTQDVNSKNANKKAMHFIKELLSAGATVVSLGHSNKDGVAQSGTAEIEQDSDAILRIDREVNSVTGEVTASITSAGRCRFNCSGVTFKMKPVGDNYKYLYSSLDSLKVTESFINIAEKVDEEKMENEKMKKFEEDKVIQKLKDKPYINVLIGIIKRLTKDPKKNPVKQMIIQMAQTEESMGKNLVDRVLRDYNKDVWKADAFITKEKKGRPTTQFKLL